MTPRLEPETHEASLRKLSERMASDWDKVFKSIEATAPYGPMCRNPELCRGGYCPRNPTCGD